MFPSHARKTGRDQHRRALPPHLSSHARTTGITLVEVVIALGILALVTAAFAALQATNLRSTRAALESRTATGILAFEASMRSLLSHGDTECAAASWLPLGWACRASVRCEPSAACQVRALQLELTSASGRVFAAEVVSNPGLENAPFRPEDAYGLPAEPAAP